MTEHINHKKPSILKRILSLLGVIDLHTKVNCWFCNQDTYILPGTRNTVNHWLCNLCDNLNIRDRNGEIIDPTPFQQGSQYRPPPRGAPTTTNNTRSNDGTLCNSCLDNQALIYLMMSDYIPDENHPDYEEKCASADDYKARLHQKYDICNDCRKLITTVVEKKMEALRVRNFTLTLSTSQQEIITPKRPSRSVYIIKGSIWYCIHTLTLLFIIYSTMYPPTGSVSDWMTSTKIKNIYFNIQDYVESSLEEGFDPKETVQLFTYYIISKIISYKDIVNCIFSMDNGYCAWDISEALTSILLINWISIKALDWHPSVESRLYEKVKNWNMYKKFQLVLLFMRLFMIWMVTKTQDIRIIWTVMIVYITTLVISVKVICKPAYVKKEVKNSFMKDNSSTEDDGSQQQQEQDDVVMTEADTEMSIPSQPLDPVENIANGIHRIRVQ